jgi:hypothetical protein
LILAAERFDVVLVILVCCGKEVINGMIYIYKKIKFPPSRWYDGYGRSQITLISVRSGAVAVVALTGHNRYSGYPDRRF